MRTSAIILSIVMLTLTGASCSLFTDDLTKAIGDIQISFPKELTVLDVPSTTGLYDNVKFLNPEDPAGASIEVSVPTADGVDEESTSGVPPGALDVVTETVKLGARIGTRTSYRMASSIESGTAEGFRVIMERYDSEYENAPLQIMQTIPDGSTELSSAWNKIKNSLAAQYGEPEL